MGLTGKLAAGGIVVSGAAVATVGLADIAQGILTMFNEAAQPQTVAPLTTGVAAAKIGIGTLGAVYAGAASMVGMIWYDPGCVGFLGQRSKLSPKKIGAILTLSLIGGAIGSNVLMDKSFGEDSSDKLPTASQHAIKPT